MILSVIIPAYNERRTIENIVRVVKDVKIGRIHKEIIIVDDFSTDGTREIVSKIKDVKVYYHKRNIGKGGAVRTGLKFATGDIILIQDADLEYDPNEYPKLIKPILEGRTRVVYGSRIIKRDIRNMYWLHYYGNKLITMSMNLLFQSNLTDIETCYKVFEKEVVTSMNLTSKGFEIEPEITAKLLKKGEKIVEVPISFDARSFAEGKKITWRDGISALSYILKYRLIG